MAVPPSVSDVIYGQCEEFNDHPRTVPTMNQKEIKLTESLALDQYFHKSKSELQREKATRTCIKIHNSPFTHIHVYIQRFTSVATFLMRYD
jgi:hypothetical protein